MTVEVPEGWEVTRLCDAVQLDRGFAFKSKDYTKAGTVNFRVSNVGKEEKYLGDVKYLPDSFLEKFSEYKLVGNEIVLVMVGATVGKLGRVPVTICPALLNQNMWVIKPKKHVVDGEYLWNAIHPVVESHIGKQQGGAYNFFKKGEFLDESIALPSLPEQKKIAEILGSVDDAIAATKAVIEQAKQVKKGLLQTLLSKGIGHTRFKQSPIGEIPESWEVKPLGECFENLNHIRKPIKKENRHNMQGDIAYYGASGIIDWVDEWLFDEPLLLISEDGANLLTRNMPIAFSISGKSFVNNHAHVFKENGVLRKEIAAEFLCHHGIDDYVTGSAQPKLNKAMVLKIPIPVPPAQEQQEIEKILESIGADVSVSQTKLKSLQTLKSGLMTDLLTGRKRVSV